MENKIIGLYRKEWKTKNGIPFVGEADGTEYIHYLENGKEYLTSGVHIWSGKKISGYISVMQKTKDIDLKHIYDYLKEFYPYAWITREVKRMVKS